MSTKRYKNDTRQQFSLLFLSGKRNFFKKRHGLLSGIAHGKGLRTAARRVKNVVVGAADPSRAVVFQLVATQAR